MEFIRQLLLSKYVGLFVRYFLTIFGTFLLSHKVANPDQIAEASQDLYIIITNFLSSPEVQKTIGAFFVTIGAGSALTKAKVVDTKNEEKLESVNITPVKH